MAITSFSLAATAPKTLRLQDLFLTSKIFKMATVIESSCISNDNIGIYVGTLMPQITIYVSIIVKYEINVADALDMKI